jgi:CheY-like chemotaxis protein
LAQILVIDDNQPLRRLLQITLEAEGHTVLLAADGAEGLRLARRQGADLVLCDLIMPVLDGLQAIRELRREFPALPVLAITGGVAHGSLDLIATARLLGAERVIRKPFALPDLLAVVKRTLDGSGPQSGSTAGSVFPGLPLSPSPRL